MRISQRAYAFILRGHAPKVLVWGLHLIHRAREYRHNAHLRNNTFSTRPFMIYVFVILMARTERNEQRKGKEEENAMASTVAQTLAKRVLGA